MPLKLGSAERITWETLQSTSDPMTHTRRGGTTQASLLPSATGTLLPASERWMWILNGDQLEFESLPCLWFAM